jgi:hypothetical protein
MMAFTREFMEEVVAHGVESPDITMKDACGALSDALESIRTLERFRGTVLSLSMAAGKRERELTARVAELEKREAEWQAAPRLGVDSDGVTPSMAVKYWDAVESENAELRAQLAKHESIHSVARRLVDTPPGEWDLLVNGEVFNELDEVLRELAKMKARAE